MTFLPLDLNVIVAASVEALDVFFNCSLLG